LLREFSQARLANLLNQGMNENRRKDKSNFGRFPGQHQSSGTAMHDILTATVFDHAIAAGNTKGTRKQEPEAKTKVLSGRLSTGDSPKRNCSASWT